MTFSRKNEIRHEEREGEIERLRAELATYRHAFETTAADRDRLLHLLERARDAASGAQPTPAIPEVLPPEAASANVAAYGPLWGRVADDFEKLAPDGPIDGQAFEAILRYGGFAQFTMYTDRAFLERLVDWQIDTLAGMGARLEDLPDAYREKRRDAGPFALPPRRAAGQRRFSAPARIHAYHRRPALGRRRAGTTVDRLNRLGLRRSRSAVEAARSEQHRLPDRSGGVAARCGAISASPGAWRARAVGGRRARSQRANHRSRFIAIT